MKNKILEIQRQSLAGQIESLKQQINPHFFFNSLNTLSGLAQEDTQKTLEFIEKLSQVFRYVLEIQEKSLVTVAEEIHFAQAYIYLLKVRFEEKFVVEIKPNLALDYMVPSLCTQLLIENCFKHNAMSTQNPMYISIDTQLGYLIVLNTKQAMSPQNNSNGIGLRNLNERSKLLCSTPIEIYADENLFSVKVPLTTNIHKNERSTN